jgi:hypothetical protein
MTKKSPTCETEAVRVQYWFGKGANLLSMDARAKSQEFCKKYKCDLVKTPRTPTQVKHLSFQGYILEKKKKHGKNRSVTKENPSKPFGISIDPKAVTEYNALTSARVVKYKLKEHLFAAKRLKNSQKQRTSGPTRHQVVPIKSSTQQELAQNQERFEPERHFRLCAIPMYPVFSDGLKRN